MGSWRDDKKLIKHWLKAVGNDEFPYGDIYRQAIINPVVLSCLIPNRYEPTTSTLDWQLQILQSIDPNADSAEIRDLLKKWHGKIISSSYNQIPKTTTIIDMGAGEGYLGRWLAQFGVKYIGIDFCKEFIREGKKRVRGLALKEQFILKEGDINIAPEKIIQIMRIHKIRPDFILFNCVLEHIKNFSPMLNALQEFLAKTNPSCELIVIVSNPDFQLPGGLKKGINRGFNTNFMMESIGVEVPVVARSWSEYPRLFRDSHFRLKKSIMLCLPRLIAEKALDDEYPNKEMAQDIAPFIFYEFVLLTDKVFAVDKEIIAKVIKHSVLSELKKEQKNQLLKNISKLRRYRFESEEIMFDQNDVGGHFWIVLDGSAQLENRSDNSEIGVPFKRGDSIGELELPNTEGESSVFFRYRCRAGKDGCEVLNIPSDEALSLLKHDRGTTYRLFNQLRNKLRAQVWLENIGSKKYELNIEQFGLEVQGSKGKNKIAIKLKDLIGVFAPYEGGKDFTPYLPKLASAICWACQISHDSFSQPLQDGAVIFENLENFRKLVLPRQSKIGDDAKQACYFLVALSIVDAFPGYDLRRDPRLYDIIRQNFFKITRDVFNHFLKENNFLRNIDCTKLAEKFLTERPLEKRNLKGTSDDLIVKLAAHLGIPKTEIKTEFKTAIKLALPYLENWFQWLHEKSPSFFIVKDRWLLYSIACSDTTIASDLVSLAQSHRIHSLLPKDLINAASIERLNRYIDTFYEYVLGDLKNRKI